MAKRSKSRVASAMESLRARLLPSPERRRRLLRWGSGAAVLVALTGVFWCGLRVQRYVESRRVFRLENWQLEYGELPWWMTPGIHAELTDLRLRYDGDGAPLGLFERGVLRKLRDRLVASPWIRDVENFRLRYPSSEDPGRILADVHFRFPIAIVRAGGRYYLTDAEGLRLGGTYADSPASWFLLPVIVGVDGGVDVPAPGEQWLDFDVREGVEVALLLHQGRITERFSDPPVDRIDVSNVGRRQSPGRSEILLRYGDFRIEWGNSPNSPYASLQSPEKRLELLYRFLLQAERHPVDEPYTVKLWATHPDRGTPLERG